MINLNKKPLIQLTGIYIVLSVAGYYLYNLKSLWGPIRKRGFDCSDLSLRNPYAEDTISLTDLYIIGVFVPIAVIVLCELVNNYMGRKADNESQCWFAKFICNVAVILTTFLFGLTVENLLKNVAKYKLGRLRPHFWTVCQPLDLDGNNCDLIPFMDEYSCSSKMYSEYTLNEVFHSFPSGHSSLSFYGMVFLVSYIQRYHRNHRLMKTTIGIFLPIIQISCIFLAWCVAMSRVLDYKHYWSDVFGGLILGSSVALAITFYMNYQRGNSEDLQEDIVKPGATNKVSQEDLCIVELASN